MFRPHSEHFALIAGLLVLAFASYQAINERPFEWFLAAGFGLVILGMFRNQVRRLKVGPGGIDLAVAEALKDPPSAVSPPGSPQDEAPKDDHIGPIKEQLAEPTQPRDLKLLISTGIPVGWAETAMGTDHIVQVTAVNTGDRPVGVSSLGLSLSDGRYIPVYEWLPTDTNVRLPAVLSPQQTASVWLDYDGLAKTLKQEKVRLDSMMAHLADGSTRKEKVPNDWRELGHE